ARLAITEPEETVFSPAVRAAPRVIVREVIPAFAVRRVVLAHGAPLAFGEIRSPPLPVLRARSVLAQARRFGVGGVLGGSGRSGSRAHRQGLRSPLRSVTRQIPIT